MRPDSPQRQLCRALQQARLEPRPWIHKGNTAETDDRMQDLQAFEPPDDLANAPLTAGGQFEVASWELAAPDSTGSVVLDGSGVYCMADTLVEATSEEAFADSLRSAAPGGPGSPVVTIAGARLLEEMRVHLPVLAKAFVRLLCRAGASVWSGSLVTIVPDCSSESSARSLCLPCDLNTAVCIDTLLLARSAAPHSCHSYRVVCREACVTVGRALGHRRAMAPCRQHHD